MPKAFSSTIWRSLAPSRAWNAGKPSIVASSTLFFIAHARVRSGSGPSSLATPVNSEANASRGLLSPCWRWFDARKYGEPYWWPSRDEPRA